MGEPLQKYNILTRKQCYEFIPIKKYFRTQKKEHFDFCLLLEAIKIVLGSIFYAQAYGISLRLHFNSFDSRLQSYAAGILLSCLVDLFLCRVNRYYFNSLPCEPYITQCYGHSHCHSILYTCVICIEANGKWSVFFYFSFYAVVKSMRKNLAQSSAIFVPCSL